MAGDGDLSVILSFLGLAAPFFIAGMTQAKLPNKARTIAMFGMAALLIVAAVAWPQIKVIMPSASVQIYNIANNVVSWFVFVMLILLATLINQWRSTYPIPTLSTAKLEELDAAQKTFSRDLNVGFTFSLDVATYFTLDELTNNIPRIQDIAAAPDEERGALYNEAEKFVRHVSDIFRGSHRGTEISALLIDARSSAERHLRTIPPEKRPSNVDPLDLAKYRTVQFQCISLTLYLSAQKTEKREQIIAQRGGLIERLNRQPSIS
jgi:hypothetical protein